jgi:hypothetical protein
MAENKYNQYVIRQPMTKSAFDVVPAPQLTVTGERHFGGTNFSYGWSYLTKPFLMVDVAHSHDYDQFFVFAGSNLENVMEFDAIVEFYLGGEKQIIDTTSVIFVPKGLVHCPLNVKVVNKPIMYMDIVLSPKYDLQRKPLTTSS